MKKALLVTRVSGFIPQHEMNNVKILQEMGYEIHYATNLNNVVYGKDNSRLNNTGIITHQVDFVRSPFSKNVIKAYIQLKQLILSGEFDLIHCHMPMSGVITRLAAQKARKCSGRAVPVLYTAHGFHFCKGAPLKDWIYYPVEKFLARYTDRLILINREDFKRAQKFKVRGKAEYVPGVGVSISEENIKYDEKPEYIQKITGKRINPKTKVLVSIGELSKRKNHQLLIDMMAYLKDMDIICIIGGTGEEEIFLYNKIKKLHLEDKVFLAGYIEDVPAVLHASDCFILPSFREGLPVVVMEAMSAGLPVIAGRIRGVTDLVKNMEGGYLVKSFEPVDFAVKVRKLFTDKEEKSAIVRKRMGKWNQERVKKFSKDVVKKRMSGIYKSIDNYINSNKS
ncbi:MAG: glycosyltransferase family 4 protein [Lachnospiraceae bacterium]|nr:glycosyltransferase family 4 protein [Lachnospiraceae bacterium]